MTKQGKILAGAILAVGLVAGLYSLNRYWIAPALKTTAKGGGQHPLAPEFALTDLFGQKLRLSDYKGRVVLLNFWATWCGPCRIEIPGFIELQNRYRDQGFGVIGISMDDSQDPVQEFYQEFRMNYPVALGDARVSELYGGLIGLPISFLIGRDGRIYTKHFGARPVSVFEKEIKELLAAPAGAEAVAFKPAGGVRSEEKIELGDPNEVNSEVPGVNLTQLTVSEQEQFKKLLETQPCTCGCKLTVLKCRHVDRKCSLSRKMAREELVKFLKSHA